MLAMKATPHECSQFHQFPPKYLVQWSVCPRETVARICLDDVDFGVLALVLISLVD
jgi:hypothetical protein